MGLTATRFRALMSTMLAALLNGKISRRLEGIEDVLTSVVFGAFDILPFDVGLAPFLRSAGVDSDGLLRVAHGIRAEATWWPWWDEYRDELAAEPDVVLRLKSPDHAPELVVVEAKWRSGKSGHGERDQLMRQVAQARSIARRTGARVRALLYVTADVAPPHADMDASRRELAKRISPGEPVIAICWTSWQAAHRVLSMCADLSPEPASLRIASDTCRVLERWGLAHFAGVSPVVSAPAYRFVPAGFRFTALDAAPPWRFGHE